MMLLHLFEAGAISQRAAVHKSQAASLHLPPGYLLRCWTRLVFMGKNKAIHHPESHRNGQQQGRCGAPALQINRLPARLPRRMKHNPSNRSRRGEAEIKYY